LAAPFAIADPLRGLDGWGLGATFGFRPTTGGAGTAAFARDGAFAPLAGALAGFSGGRTVASTRGDEVALVGALGVAFLLFNTTLEGRSSALAFLDLRASGRGRVAFTSFGR
jgi:hypothetical protein